MMGKETVGSWLEGRQGQEKVNLCGGLDGWSGGRRRQRERERERREQVMQSHYKAWLMVCKTSLHLLQSLFRTLSIL